jgi:hypothetical protein
MDGTDLMLNFERMRRNREMGIETNLLPDTNLMKEIDRVCHDSVPATDEGLRGGDKDQSLVELVTFLRECDQQQLPYAWTPFFAFSEMPRNIAQERIGRFEKFAKKFGISWQSDDSGTINDLSAIGRSDHTQFSALNSDEQSLLAMSFSSLILIHIINRDLVDCSPIGKFRRYAREQRERIGVFSARETMIARYIFAGQENCPAPLEEVRIQVDRNFGRRKKKRPILPGDMETAALNGASDLLFLNAMNIAETRGLDGTHLDCWLLSFDGKLRIFCDACFNTDMGTGEAGKFLIMDGHGGATEYWDQTEAEFRKLKQQGAKRIDDTIRAAQYDGGSSDAIEKRIQSAIAKRLHGIRDSAFSLIKLAQSGLY